MFRSQDPNNFGQGARHDCDRSEAKDGVGFLRMRKGQEMKPLPVSKTVMICMMSGILLGGEQSVQVDALVHPRTEQQTITVGGAGADIPGFTSGAIQQAVDILSRKGGGTVLLNPGDFDMIGPVQLTSNLTLRGAGDQTILRKSDGVRTAFVVDADYGELKLTVADPAGFVPGMGVQIYDDSQKSGWAVSTAQVTSVDGKTIYIDTYLARDYDADDNGFLSNACSVISAVNTDKVRIADLLVEGNKKTNDYLNGCRGGAVYVHKSTDTKIENVRVKDFNGDGISWQITENVTVSNCDVSGCTNTGLHPGTGSPGSLVEGNAAHHNDADGLFICWRVQHGIVRNNRFFQNARYGLCTGHKDTDMRFENNHIFENGSHGVYFRYEKEANAPHRNTFVGNIVENNGRDSKQGGFGFCFNSPAKNVVLKDNTIRDTGGGTQKAAVFVEKDGLPVKMENNAISGHPKN